MRGGWRGGRGGGKMRRGEGRKFIGSIYRLNCIPVFISIVGGGWKIYAVMRFSLKIDLQFYPFYYSANVLNLFNVFGYTSYKIYFFLRYNVVEVILIKF